MPPTRQRPNSLTIPIPPTPTWRTPRPPTPRRATFPLPGTISTPLLGYISPNAPPIPPLSYWDPETPSPHTTPMSPRNPFLSPPPSKLAFNPYAMFPMASPLLPASPLSIFDHAVSPTTGTFFLAAMSRTPSPTKATFLHPASPLTPRFLFPRTPPPCPLGREDERRTSAHEGAAAMVVRRRGSGTSSSMQGGGGGGGGKDEMVRLRGKMKVEFYYTIAARKLREMERAREERRLRRKIRAMGGWKVRMPWKEKAAQEEATVKVERRRFHAMFCS